MRETAADLARLQDLLDASFASASDHLTSIMEPERRLTAERIAADLTGILVLNVATVTARGEPRISAVDGHLLHGRLYFTTSGSAVKAAHLRARDAVSVSCTPRDGYGLFAHGRAVELTRADDERAAVVEHLTGVYGGSPEEWGGADVRIYRVEPHWLVAFAFERGD